MESKLNLICVFVMLIRSIISADLSAIVLNLIEDDELDTWKASEEISSNYPYYLAGYDEDSKPIWISEAGKWDVRKIVEEGGENFANFDKYVNQLAQRFLKSMKRSAEEKSSPAGDPLIGAIVVLDLEGYNMWQLSSVKTVSYILKKTRQLEPVARNVEIGYVINTNYVAETMINLVRPILGQIMERIEIYGANKSRWMPRILKRIPKSCLPEWYGGQKGFQPARVYG